MAKSDLPMCLRARVWLPAEPSTPTEVEEILRYCNNLPQMGKWTSTLSSRMWCAGGGGPSEDDGSIFSLDRLFEEAGIDSTDDGAELALLERSLEDEDPPN